MDDVELRHLTTFEAVAREGGFGRAAAALHLAQPSVSAQIRRLENEVGLALFERTTRRVALTAAGEILLAHARRVLHQLDVARADLDTLRDVVRGRLRLGATLVTGTLDLPRLLGTFRSAHPGVAVTLRAGLVGDLLTELRRGHLDAVLGPVYPERPDGLTVRPLATDTLVLITPPGRLDLPSPAPLSLVRDEPFVCLEPGSGLRGLLDAAAAPYGFSPRVEFETHGPASIRELVAAGLGVAVLAASATRGPGPHVDRVALENPPAYPPIGLFTGPRPPGAALTAWQAHVRQDAS